MDVINYKVNQAKLFSIGSALLNYSKQHQNQLFLTDLDLFILNEINKRSLIYANLQAIFRIRFGDLSSIDLNKLFFFEPFFITTKKNKMIMSIALPKDVEFPLFTFDVNFIYLNNLNYDVYAYDLKSTLRKLQMPTWFNGRNVTHCFRKIYATNAKRNNLSQNSIAKKLQQFDTNSQKDYIDLTVKF